MEAKHVSLLAWRLECYARVKKRLDILEGPDSLKVRMNAFPTSGPLISGGSGGSVGAGGGGGSIGNPPPSIATIDLGEFDSKGPIGTVVAAVMRDELATIANDIRRCHGVDIETIQKGDSK